jgi:transposase
MTSMTTTAAALIGGVDTHADTHYAAALDPVGRLLGSRRFRADGPGYRQLLFWLESFGGCSASVSREQVATARAA